MSSLSLSKQTKKETMRQASRKKKFPITYSPNRIFTLQKSLDENVILHSASGVFENSVFQFTMTEATEAFFWLSAIYLPCMSCQNAASIFLYIGYIYFFLCFSCCEGEREQVEDGYVTVLICHVKHIQHSMRF